MKKSFSYPIIFMVLLTVFFTSILAFLNYSTAEKVDYNKEIELRETILYVFDIEPESGDPEDIEKTFDEKITEEEINGERVYTVEENDEIKGYAFPISGTGLWGTIEGYAGITSDYTELLGLDFTEHSETPGLGGRISEESYKEQFRDLDLTQTSDGEYIIYTPASGGNVDAIAGATLTSQSVSKFLNVNIENFITEMEGE